MSFTVARDRTGKMRHVAHVREHRFALDELPAVGGEDTGPTLHDLYDTALAACEVLDPGDHRNHHGAWLCAQRTRA